MGSCVTAPAAWASGPSALASRGPWGHRYRGTRGPARSRERPCHGDAGVYTDRRKRPYGAVLGHSCTLLRRCGQAWGQRSVHRLAKMASRSRFGAFVYTVATQGSRELRRVARVPQPPWCAGGAPSVAIFSWLKELCAVRELRPHVGQNTSSPPTYATRLCWYTRMSSLTGAALRHGRAAARLIDLTAAACLHLRLGDIRK